MPELDKIIHEKARLLILTYLASQDDIEISFTELQQKLDLTSGNLSVQLRRLKEAKYLEVNKTFKDNKPYTTVNITSQGSKALNQYVVEMEQIIKALKN